MIDSPVREVPPYLPFTAPSDMLDVPIPFAALRFGGSGIPRMLSAPNRVPRSSVGGPSMGDEIDDVSINCFSSVAESGVFNTVDGSVPEFLRRFAPHCASVLGLMGWRLSSLAKRS
jgi:hypothetical protein